VLSLVFVPAMFMLMDDIGTLFWRFGKRLIVSHGESDADSRPRSQERNPQARTKIIRAPAAE
jgi:hypothetical protein